MCEIQLDWKSCAFSIGHKFHFIIDDVSDYSLATYALAVVPKLWLGNVLEFAKYVKRFAKKNA